MSKDEQMKRKEIPITLKSEEMIRLKQGKLNYINRSTCFLAPGDLVWLKEDVVVDHKHIPALFMPKRYARSWFLVTAICDHPEEGYVVCFEPLSN